MFSTRWIKLWRDIQITPWRIGIMLLTIAVGLFGFATMLTSYSLLTREVNRNYLQTNPASATLKVDNIDSDLLEKIRAFPGIAQAQAGTTVNTEIYFPDGTIHPLKIFVVENFNYLKINTISHEAGEWPPLPNTLLLERDSLVRMQIKIGDVIKICMNDGNEHLITISGTVHDPAMPVPSMAAYAYTSPSTLNNLQISTTLSELKITLRNNALDADAIEKATSQLALWIQQQGHKVSHIKIPPPGEHPHQKIIFSVAGILFLFSGIALVLSAVLTATIIDGLMTQQIKQIGIMKAIGASSKQIATLYLTFVLMISLLAMALGIPSGINAGLAMTKAILTNLNFALLNPALPQSAYFALIIAGLSLPLIMAAIPIIKFTQQSAHSAISHGGTPRHYYAYAVSNSWLTTLNINRSLIMALRNSFRNRGRLIFILTLLACAGGMFITSLNLKHELQQHLIAAAAERRYDLEISLRDTNDRKKIIEIIQKIASVEKVESWGSAVVARRRSDGLNIERTYPDGGHGTLIVNEIQQGSQLLSLNVDQGNWLDHQQNAETSSEATVVLNYKALESFPNTKISDFIELRFAESTIKLRVIGIARQKMTGAMAYVSTSTYRKLTGQGEDYKNYRITLKQHDDEFVESAKKQIETELIKKSIPINYTLTEKKLRNEVDGHFTMLLNATFSISILIAVVGIFGLTSVMSAHVFERVREFGIMRSIGASSITIVRNLIIEALFIGIISWFFAVILSVPLSVATSSFIGHLIFDEAFPFALSFNAFWAWLLIVVIGAVLASVYPARKATKLTIHESFTY